MPRHIHAFVVTTKVHDVVVDDETNSNRSSSIVRSICSSWATRQIEQTHQHSRTK